LLASLRSLVSSGTKARRSGCSSSAECSVTPVRYTVWVIAGLRGELARYVRIKLVRDVLQNVSWGRRPPLYIIIETLTVA
jgi:hypothetical protein